MVNSAHDYHAACDNNNKEILEQLAADSEDTDVANVINCYAIGQPDKQIRKKMDSFLLPPLKRAAEYLGLTVNGEVRKLKNDIITEIILRIESLLMDLCSICGEYYNITLKNTPAFKCVTCQQGCHQPCLEQMVTVLAEVPEEIKNSFHFFCAKCLSSFSHTKPPAAKINTPTKPASNIVIKGRPGDDEVEVANEDEEDPEPKVTPPVCRKYRRRECPHGASGKTLVDGKPCAFSHPRRCRRYQHNGTHPKFGCTNKNCKYLHPELCKFSVRNRVCLYLDCRFTHLKFTRRFDPDSSYHNQQNSNSQHNYERNPQQSYDKNPQQSYHRSPNQSYQRDPQQSYQINPQQQSYASDYRPQEPNSPQAPPPENSSNPDVRFLVKMFQEFQTSLKDINLKLAAPSRQVALTPVHPSYPTCQPMRMPPHPHC